MLGYRRIKEGLKEYVPAIFCYTILIIICVVSTYGVLSLPVEDQKMIMMMLLSQQQ